MLCKFWCSLVTIRVQIKDTTQEIKEYKKVALQKNGPKIPQTVFILGTVTSVKLFLFVTFRAISKKPLQRRVIQLFLRNSEQGVLTGVKN